MEDCWHVQQPVYQPPKHRSGMGRDFEQNANYQGDELEVSKGCARMKAIFHKYDKGNKFRLTPDELHRLIKYHQSTLPHACTCLISFHQRVDDHDGAENAPRSDNDCCGRRECLPELEVEAHDVIGRL
eukprot:3935978-Rhodomonas_salina.1